MNPEQQRHAIHEFLGWEKVYEGSIHYAWRRGEEFHYLNSEPNYLNDLNAMHEAEKTICGENFDTPLWMAYLRNLDRVINKRRAHATAAQRAEAFCRVI